MNVFNQSPNTYTPKKDFSTLSPEVRQIWSKIPNNMKAVILRSRAVDSNEGIKNHNKMFITPLNLLLILLGSLLKLSFMKFLLNYC